MLRELQTTMNKPAVSMYKAGEEKILTGMAVVKNEAAKTFEFPAEETAADLFLVDKERIATGANAGRDNLSDYEEEFVTLKEGEFGKLIAYYPGEKFATDQYVKGELAVGDRVAVNAEGMWVKATVASKYKYVGEMVDVFHTLAMIEVSDTAVAN